MNPLQTLITTTDFIGHNFAYNQGFPSDEQFTTENHFYALQMEGAGG